MSAGDSSKAYEEGGVSPKASSHHKVPDVKQVSGSVGLGSVADTDTKLAAGGAGAAAASSRRSKKLMRMVSRSLAEDD